ncbi:MAG: DEAD/DEAH box helicase family protein [Bacteroidetes bacterium]|nr:DEAD/DEAH box helicase family protein [Bacteroidota bacterium]
MLPENLYLFKSLFRGRDEIFAIRWEKGGKSSYFPAYDYDPYQFRLHKIKGGTIQNFSDKKLLSLSDGQITKHLNGEHFIGIYPLLKDNTSWFIAADFDKANWIEECRSFLTFCHDQGLPAYLERSRSGKGGHVWLFFDGPYPARKSRKIIINMLESTGLFSSFDKNSSFDRLFPNQDSLSGKGFGNLIALPLNKLCLEQGNNCFINPETLVPYKDQWTFLHDIQRVSVTRLDQLYEQSLKTEGLQKDLRNQSIPETGKIRIELDQSIKISRNGLSLPLINFLKDELNFLSSEFIIKKKLGKNTWGSERYFNFIEEKDDFVIIPRGMAGRLLRFCKESNIEYDFYDERKKVEPVSLTMDVQLREHQKLAVAAAAKKDMGVIVAPPGTGKTIVGLKIIAEKQQPALIIVHRKQLAEQWIERIQSFLGIPKNEIGSIGQGKGKVGKKITIALIQSLSRMLESADQNGLTNKFGTIIVDECHHIPAESYRNIIGKLSSFYLYGLTATPFRKYNDGKLIFIHLGEIISEIKAPDISTLKTAKIIIRNTELDVPFNSKTDKFEILSKVLVHDSARNKLILKDVISELTSGKKVVIITERKEHLDSLNQYLKQSYETIVLSGDDPESSRTMKWKILKDGSFQALITTGQFFGEGTDIQNIDRLFLVYPFSFQGKLIQYIGRVQRSEIAPVIYDYRDIKIDYLNKLFLKRNTWYRKLEKQASLFDEPEPDFLPAGNTLSIEETITIAIDDLEFRYGTIAFRYQSAQLNQELEFEIENDQIRPEFDVLKPYFSKILKKKTVNVLIQAEFQEKTLISQLATSSDLEKINGEIIDIARFRFVSKFILGGSYNKFKGNLMDINQLQSQEDTKPSLYESGEQLLGDLLKNKKVIHYRQLRYLAEKHESDILKLRFVLNPFSFVFLLSGQEQFHLVMETLDTREATYIWHIEKDKQELRNQLQVIDRQLNMIRNDGRQAFLESQPMNFSRVLHDYSDEQKGFILWKDLLEERLV